MYNMYILLNIIIINTIPSPDRYWKMPIWPSQWLRPWPQFEASLYRTRRKSSDSSNVTVWWVNKNNNSLCDIWTGNSSMGDQRRQVTDDNLYGITAFSKYRREDDMTHTLEEEQRSRLHTIPQHNRHSLCGVATASYRKYILRMRHLLSVCVINKCGLWPPDFLCWNPKLGGLHESVLSWRCTQAHSICWEQQVIYCRWVVVAGPLMREEPTEKDEKV